jgi:hypothetical protein
MQLVVYVLKISSCYVLISGRLCWVEEREPSILDQQEFLVVMRVILTIDTLVWVYQADVWPSRG